MGRVPWAPEVFNCSAPDTGNMEMLERYGTEAQKEQWLEPLLAGEIRSAFAHDRARGGLVGRHQHRVSIERDGDDYVINGRKWWIDRRRRSALQDLHLHGQDRPDEPTATASSR